MDFKEEKAPILSDKKNGYMKDAQNTWTFLTLFDLSTIKTEGQLTEMVKTRSSVSAEEAKRQVQAWTQGKLF